MLSCFGIRQAADGFDVVAVRVTHETAEVVWMVFGEDPGRVQDFRADGDGGGVELVNDCPAVGFEGYVQLARLASLGWPDPERGAFAVREAGPLAVSVVGPQAEWLKDCLVERPTVGDVGHLQRDMINHAIKYDG